jgi:hypothetical protein
MAKKTAKVSDAKAEGQPQVEAVKVPASGIGGMTGLKAAMAAMKGAGAKEAPAKAGKTHVQTVKVDDANVAKAVEQYIIEDAKQKAAEGHKKSLAESIKDWGDTQWRKIVRESQQFCKTISLAGKLNFGSGKIVIGKPKKDDPALTEEAINEGLERVFAKEYSKFFEPRLEIAVASEYANASSIQLLQNKLGLDLFSRMFPTFRIVVDLKRDGPGDDANIELKKAAALSEAVEKLVKEAVDKGYLALWSPSLTSNKESLAAELARLQTALDAGAVARSA